MATKLNVISFGAANFFVASSMIPEGDYAVEHDWIIWKGKDGKGQERVGIRVRFHPLTTDVEGIKEQFYSLGSKAHLLFRPHPENSKMLVSVPDAKGSLNANNQTNLAVYMEHFKSAGLPDDLLDNDLSVIDGTWVHIQGIPEPEGRKDMRSNEKKALVAGAAQVEVEVYKPSTIPVVSQILPNGAPWEDGGGGIPEAGAVKAASKAPAAAAKTAPAAAATKKPAGKKAPVLEDIFEIAKLGVTDVLEKNEETLKKGTGVSVAVIQSGAFEFIEKAYGEETAGKFMEEIANDKEQMEAIYDEFGFEKKGVKVFIKP